MRECIYCGRSLEKDEKCSCAMSVLKRREKENLNNESDAVPEKEKKKEKREKHTKSDKAQAKAEKARRKAEQRANKTHKTASSKNVFLNLGRNLISFLKSPTEAIMNPVRMGKIEILMLAAFEGTILGLCVFSILTGTSRGALTLVGSLIGFNGLAGYNFLGAWFMSALWGILGNVALFLIYTAIFFAIGKWIFRQFATYWDYAKRLVFAMLPLTFIGVLGTILGMFSQITFATLLLCGLTGNIAITYEVLRSMWSSKSGSRTLYAMMIGIFVYLTVLLTIVMNIVRLLLI